MGKSLAKNVYVGSELYEAGSTPPKEIADQITNPKAWDANESADSTPAGEVEDGEVEEPKAPAKRPAAKKS